MEKHVEKKYRDAIVKAGGLCIKLVAISFTGLPDRLCLLPGARLWFAEFKFGKNGLSPAQQKVKNWLEKLGFEVKIINEHNVEQEIEKI